MEYFDLPKALAFDLDGTLAPSKNHIQSDMVSILCKLLSYFPVAVVSGASKEQFDNQFLFGFPVSESFLSNLFLFPQNGAQLLIYKDGQWIIEYEEKLNDEEVSEISSILKQVILDFQLSESLGYGDIIENRGSQITFSALGQHAPLDLKEKWDPKREKRLEMAKFIKQKISDRFDIRIGGATSIDITKKGMNKAFAMRKFIEILKVSPKDILFIGDALFEGGNDEIVKEAGVLSKQVSNPQATFELIHDIIQKYEETHRESSVG